MNREQRRKNGNKKPINYNKQQLDKIKKAAAFDAAEVAFQRMILIPVYVMRNHYKWGSKRISEFLDVILETYNDFADERFNLKDLEKTLEEETGVYFSKRIEKNNLEHLKRMEKMKNEVQMEKLKEVRNNDRRSIKKGKSHIWL